MKIRVFDSEEVPNPLATSEFDLKSNFNGRRESRDYENENYLRNQRLLMELNGFTKEEEIKPKVINDTGSLKTTTV